MLKTLAVKENNMSSPFSKKFMNKKSSLFMTQKQEKTFGPEGTNPNPEIYEAIKKNDSETSSTPLEYSATVATGYVSTRDSLQRMFDNIAEGTSKALEAVSDPQSQANRLERRIQRRSKRAGKKGADDRIINEKTGEVILDLNPKRTKFDKKTSELETRRKKAQEKADSNMTKKLKQYEELYNLKNPKGTTYDQKMNQIIADYDERSGKGSFAKLGNKEQNKIIASRLQYTD